ncbi:hypothetical protein CR513_20167, partial [Mucuna pruriens]
MLNDFNSPKYFFVEVDNLDKFDPKFDKEIFIEYSTVVKYQSVEDNVQILDNKLKTDEAEISSRNWQMKTYHLE